MRIDIDNRIKSLIGSALLLCANRIGFTQKAIADPKKDDKQFFRCTSSSSHFTSTGASYKGLPTVPIPETFSPDDSKALNIVSQASVIPITKGTFPDYRPRSLQAKQTPLSAWTVKDYQAIVHLRNISNELRLLTLDQVFTMESKFGGANRNGIKRALQARANGSERNATGIDIDGDNVDSLVAAAPSSWNSIIERTTSLSGSRVDHFDIGKLKSTFGEAQTNAVLKTFYEREQEKGRRHEVWIFGLAEEEWEDKIVHLKNQLKSCGYEAFALEFEPTRKFFSTRDEAEAFSKKLAIGAHPTVREEGAAELIIDKDANVISSTGTVVKRVLDPGTKERLEAQQNQNKTVMNVLNFLGGGNMRPTDYKTAGPTFQFPGYKINWIPAQATIEIQDNKRIKISVPRRFAVNSKSHQAFASGLTP